MEYSFLATLQRVVRQDSRKLAAERNLYRNEWHTLYRIRFQRRFAAGAGARDFGILKQSSERDWQSEFRAAYSRGMVQRQRFPETATGSSGSISGIRRRRPQRCRRARIRGLGLLGVQEHSADGIQGASPPRRAVQLPEPYQFPFAGQRYRIADVRSNPIGCWSARDSGGAKISFLMPN